jgi:CheY-like chemotaxis protein
VLISDLSMPGEDGFSFLASVRALPPELGSETPAVAFSAMSPVRRAGPGDGGGLPGLPPQAG